MYKLSCNGTNYSTSMHFIHLFPYFSNRNSTRPNDTIVGQCCYTNGVLVTKETGGHDTKSDPKHNFFEHFSKDLWPLIICCEELNDGVNEVCQTILNDQEVYFAKSFAQGYTAPQVGTFLASFTMHALPTMTCKNIRTV